MERNGSLLWKVPRPNIPHSPGARGREESSGLRRASLTRSFPLAAAPGFLSPSSLRGRSLASLSTRSQAPVPEVTSQERQVVAHVVRSVPVIFLVGHVCLPAKEPGTGRCPDAGGGSAPSCRHAPGPQRLLAAPTRRTASDLAEKSERMQTNQA